MSSGEVDYCGKQARKLEKQETREFGWSSGVVHRAVKDEEQGD